MAKYERPMRTLTVEYSFQGWSTQTFVLEDDCPYTPKEIVEKLNAGKVVCTLTDLGELYELLPGNKVRTLGWASGIDPQGEMFDFELK